MKENTKTKKDLLLEIEKRKHAEEELRLNEERFRVAIKNSDFIPSQFDRNLRYQWIFNPHPDFDPSKVIGKRDDELEDSEGTKKLVSLKQQVIESGVGLRTEISFERSDGNQTYDFTIEPLRDSRGKIIGGTCAAFDITKYKRAEEAYVASEERYRNLVKYAPTGIYEIDLKTMKFIEVNDIMCQILGYSRHELLSMKLEKLLDNKGRKRFRERISRLLEGKEVSEQTEYKVKTKDGRNIWALLNVTVNHEKGQPRSISAIAHDITERRKIEHDLAHERELLRKIIDNIPVMLIMWDPKLSRFLLNTYAQKVLGWTNEDANQEDFMEKVYPDEAYHHEVSNYMQSLKTGWHEWICTTKDGCCIPCDWANVILTDDTMIGIGVDLRERKLAEEKILQQNALLNGINRIFKETLSTRTEAELGKICLSVVEQITKSQFCFLGEIGPDGMLHDIAVCDPGGQLDKMFNRFGHRKLPVKFKIKGLYGRVLKDGKSLLTNDPSSHPDSIGVPKDHPVLKSFLGVPLNQDEKTIGMIAAGNREGGYRKEDKDALEALAPVIVESFGRKRVEAAVKRSQEELRKSKEELETKVKQRTNELARVNELLETVFSSIDLAIAYMDKDFNFIRVNRAYAEADDREPEFFMGKNHFDLYPNEENEAIFRKVVETGKSHFVYSKPFEYAEHPERGITYWDWSLQPVTDLQGKVYGIILSLVNVTDRVQAEESVLRNEALLRTVFETLPVGVWIADKEGRIIQGNQAGQQIWKGAKYVGVDQFKEYKGWWVKTGKKIKPEEWGVARAVKKGEISTNEEIEIECFDGTRRIINNAAVPILNDKQEIIGAIAINEDITERKKIEKNLRQMQKMEALGTLAGGIAHDFNNILMPITINAEMALFDIQEGSPLYDCLFQIQEAAKRGKDLVNQIITFSRQKEQKMIPVKIIPIIEETIKFLRSGLPKDIEIYKKIEVERDTVLGDPTQIQQVLMNLFNNAVYSMKEKGGKIEISLAGIETDSEMIAKYPDLKLGKHLKLIVSDRGCGMKPEVLDLIFDPFFTTKKPGEGTGMGLSVVHGIVKNHNGAITVYSEPEKGTVFTIFLPHAEGDFRVEPKLSETIPKGKGRIFFIDDEESQIKSIHPMLERLGYTVQVEIDSVKAIETFKESPESFDLIITDQTMPKLTGNKLAETVLSIRPDIPVILCTGFSEMIDADKAESMGISAFLMKPFTIKEIAETINRVLKK